MPLRISLLAVLLCAATASAAEVKTLKGEVVKGDFVSIDAKEVVVAVTGTDEKKTIPITQIATLDFSAAPKMPADTVYHDIELTDGTILHCAQLQFKGTEFTAKLLGDAPTVTVPMKAVANVLWEASKPQLRAKWTDRIEIRKQSKTNADGFGRLDGETLNLLPVTILSADDKGETFTYERESKQKDTRKLAGVIGLYFHRGLDAAAPAVVCKVTDIGQNTIMVSKVELKEGALHVTTSAQVTLIYKPEQLVRLDYSTANLTYLSDLTPSRVIEKTSTMFDHYRKDHNIDNGPIRLGSDVYPKGLALHCTTELEYRIKGDYRTLQGLAGIDRDVGGFDGPVALRIYATTADEANKLIFDETFNRADQKNLVKPIQLNVKDVQILRIVVTNAQADAADLAPEPGMGLHLDLANIRVVK